MHPKEEIDLSVAAEQPPPLPAQDRIPPGDGDGDEWQEIGGEVVSWDQTPIVIGLYLGADHVTTRYGEQTVHRIQTSETQVSSVFGTVVLNRLLKAVRPGARVRIEYLGRKSRAKDFKVSVSTSHIPF